MITARDLLAHLEVKVEATIAGGEGLPARMEEMGRFLREIAEAALVAGDELTLREVHRLAAKVAAWMPGQAAARRPEMAPPARARTCPRCGQRFRGTAGPLEQLGVPLCEACARELLAGIRL